MREADCLVCLSPEASTMFSDLFYDPDIATDQILDDFQSLKIDCYWLFVHMRHEILKVIDLNQPTGRRFAVLRYIDAAFKNLLMNPKKINPRALTELVTHLDKIDLGLYKKGTTINLIGGPISPSEVDSKIDELSARIAELEKQELKQLTMDH